MRYLLALLLTACSCLGQGFTFYDLPFMAGGKPLSSVDLLTTYSPGQILPGLNGSDSVTQNGATFAGPYVSRTAYIGVRMTDQLTSYTPTASIVGLSDGTGTWLGSGQAYASRTAYLKTLAVDDLTSYVASGQAVDSLNGGTGWAGAYQGTVSWTQPTNAITLSGGSATFVAAVTGVGTLTSWQWKKNGTAIAGATQSSYVLSGAGASDFANYTVDGTSTRGTFTSPNALLAVVTTTTVSNWLCVAENIAPASPTAIASNTVWAVDTFWNGIVTDGLDSKLYSVNVLVPDNLSAALTPLLNTGGPSVWVNHGFVSGDLTVNGLIGDASAKYVDTGIKDSTTFASVNDVSFTVYAYSINGGGGLQGIASGDDNSGFMIMPSRSGNTQWYDYGAGNGGTGTIHVSNPGAGYFCGTRTASNADAIYWANSGNAHASVVTGSSTPAYALIGQNVYIWGWDAAGSPFGGVYIGDRYSYASIGKGLTSTDSSHQFSRVQTLRTALGGGFQ